MKHIAASVVILLLAGSVEISLAKRLEDQTQLNTLLNEVSDLYPEVDDTAPCVKTHVTIEYERLNADIDSKLMGLWDTFFNPELKREGELADMYTLLQGYGFLPVDATEIPDVFRSIGCYYAYPAYKNKARAKCGGPLNWLLVGVFKQHFYTNLLGFPDYPAFSTQNLLGPNGEDTVVGRSSQRSFNKMWNMDPRRYVLYGAHGAMMSDTDALKANLIDLYSIGYGGPSIAQAVCSYWEGKRGSRKQFDCNQRAIDDINMARFMINLAGISTDSGAFTFNGVNALGISVLGDGIIAAINNQFAVESVVAHEFAHSIQFAQGLLPYEKSPASTRYHELMADAFAAYMLAHPNGGSLQAKRILEVVAAQSSVGRCNFDSKNHHGTPEQRATFVKWGADLVEPNHILEPKDFIQQFALEFESRTTGNCDPIWGDMCAN